MNIRQLEIALAEIDHQLRNAAVSGARFHTGWERIAELQSLREEYRRALGEQRAEALELALAA